MLFSDEFSIGLSYQKHFKVHLADIIVDSAKINFDVEGVCSFSGLLVILACILSYFCQFVSTCSLGSVSIVVTNNLEVEDYGFTTTWFWKTVVLYNGDELLAVASVRSDRCYPSILSGFLLQASSSNLAPIWLPHCPPCKWTISLIFIFNYWNKSRNIHMNRYFVFDRTQQYKSWTRF